MHLTPSDSAATVHACVCVCVRVHVRVVMGGLVYATFCVSAKESYLTSLYTYTRVLQCVAVCYIVSHRVAVCSSACVCAGNACERKLKRKTESECA